MLLKTQLRWAGHVVRMPEKRLPNNIPLWRSEKRFKDTLKASLEDFGVDHNAWGRTAQNRAAWRGAINKGAATYESRRLETAQSKRATRKSRASSASGTLESTVLPCPHCPRTLRANTGLISHLKTHAHPPGMTKVFFPQERRTPPQVSMIRSAGSAAVSTLLMSCE